VCDGMMLCRESVLKYSQCTASDLIGGRYDLGMLDTLLFFFPLKFLVNHGVALFGTPVLVVVDGDGRTERRSMYLGRVHRFSSRGFVSPRRLRQTMCLSLNGI
jgi:hypothetical protein